MRPIPVRARDRMIPRVATLGIIQASRTVKHNLDRQFLCLSQESSRRVSTRREDSLTSPAHRPTFSPSTIPPSQNQW
jgi:hypothetical protein